MSEAKRKQRQRRELRAYLASRKASGCIDCGEKRLPCLEFHHVHGKDFTISHAVQQRLSIARVEKELQRCVLVCKNCHAMRRHEERIGMMAFGSHSPAFSVSLL